MPTAYGYFQLGLKVSIQSCHVIVWCLFCDWGLGEGMMIPNNTFSGYAIAWTSASCYEVLSNGVWDQVQDWGNC